ncbi:MAG: Ppx/GppA phosphatase family protein [Planctomycetota bacterium]
MGTASPNDLLVLAAVDLGSNSFHMVIGRDLDDGLGLVDALRVPVRLAAGLREDGALEGATVESALACLAQFGQRLRDIPPGQIRAVGTHTLRQAERAGDFLSRARKTLGVPIEILSGAEEARLIFLGVARDIAADRGRRLVVDIGGGSTECIVGEGFEAGLAASLPMGCVTFSRRFFPDGRLTAERFARARIAARLELEAEETRFRQEGWSECIGSSGTILAIADIQAQAGFGAGAIRRAGLKKIEKAMVAQGHVEALDLPGLKSDRRPVLPGGVAVLRAIFEALEIDAMRLSKAALREGLLWDLRGRLRREGLRDRTVRTLAERYRVDHEQAERVERTARHCFAQVAASWELDEEPALDALAWAARLHEVGLAIAHGAYHRHGAYILANSDMPGFSREGQQLVAVLVREHRRKLTLSQFDTLIPPYRARGVRLCILLRLAVRLHRARSPRPLPELTLRARDRRLEVSFPKGWLKRHPLTRADLEEEKALLALAGFELAVE